MPTALVAAFPHDQAGTPLMRVLATPRGDRPYLDLCFWTSFALLAGLPATTAPVGFTPGGLPVGIQIVGPYLEDATPIDLAGPARRRDRRLPAASGVLSMPMNESQWAALWPLDPTVAFLNHGSYGACPTEILAHQAALRAELEAEPVRFLGRELDGRLDAARAALGAFVGADPDDLAFIGNATSGVNAVLRSLDRSRRRRAAHHRSRLRRLQEHARLRRRAAPARGSWWPRSRSRSRPRRRS